MPVVQFKLYSLSYPESRGGSAAPALGRICPLPEEVEFLKTRAKPQKVKRELSSGVQRKMMKRQWV